jgi:hypothetical protein
MTQSDDHRLSALFDRMRDAAQNDTVTVGDVVSAFGRRSMIPFLLVPAFLTASPLSGIPGFRAWPGLSLRWS